MKDKNEILKDWNKALLDYKNVLAKEHSSTQKWVTFNARYKQLLHCIDELENLSSLSLRGEEKTEVSEILTWIETKEALKSMSLEGSYYVKATNLYINKATGWEIANDKEGIITHVLLSLSSTSLKTENKQAQLGYGYSCMDCGNSINEGEYKTFGVCDNCYNKNRDKQLGTSLRGEKEIEELCNNIAKITIGSRNDFEMRDKIQPIISKFLNGLSLSKEGEEEKKPLSEISDEDAIKVADILITNGLIYDGDDKVKAGKIAISNIFSDDLDEIYNPSDVIKVYQYLKPKNYQLPKYY